MDFYILRIIEKLDTGIKKLKKAFNVAATIIGANIATLTGLIYAAGFAPCPEGSIGACINPLAVTHTGSGLALTCLFAAAGAVTFALGYANLQAKASQQPVPKP